MTVSGRRGIVRSVALGCLTMLALCAAACSSGSTSGDAEIRKIDVMLDWSPNTNHAGMYLAKAEGW